jgi:hypothetical protein
VKAFRSMPPKPSVAALSFIPADSRLQRCTLRPYDDGDHRVPIVRRSSLGGFGIISAASGRTSLLLNASNTAGGSAAIGIAVACASSRFRRVGLSRRSSSTRMRILADLHWRARPLMFDVNWSGHFAAALPSSVKRSAWYQTMDNPSYISLLCLSLLQLLCGGI